jgi:prephenate dehydratase
MTATTRVGIQGGRGSFNEEAATRHLPDVLQGKQYALEYLHTSGAVLEALTAGSVDYGQLALSNSLAGPYEESITALCGHVVNLSGLYSIPIRHAVMGVRGSSLATISRLLSHQQALKQCARKLAHHIPGAEQEVGTGPLTDPASVAAAMAAGHLPPTVAIVSNPALAELYGLTILLSNAQDDDNNRSWFALVSPR